MGIAGKKNLAGSEGHGIDFYISDAFPVHSEHEATIILAQIVTHTHEHTQYSAHAFPTYA